MIVIVFNGRPDFLFILANYLLDISLLLCNRFFSLTIKFKYVKIYQKRTIPSKKQYLKHLDRKMLILITLLYFFLKVLKKSFYLFILFYFHILQDYYSYFSMLRMEKPNYFYH
jgi:hypothetical protein